jgi:phosphoenolpyruvate-protein phosphotransferase (PTS system enzyme I)
MEPTVSSPSSPPATLAGTGASSGLGTGICAVVPPAGAPVGADRRVVIDDLDTVFERARAALEREAEEAGGEVGDILRGQLAMLSDPALRQAIDERLEAPSGDGSPPLPTAIVDGAQTFRDRLGDSSVARIRERVSDVDDLADRLVSIVTDTRSGGVVPAGEGPFVLIGDDLLPSQTAQLDPRRVAALVLEGSGPTAHAAIIARALSIPLVTGVAGARERIAEGATVVVDGGTGEVWVDPDEDVLETLRARATSVDDTPSPPVRTVPLDGGAFEVAVNIGSVPESQRAARAGARAVGLLRSELLAFAGVREREGIADAVRAVGAAIQGPIVFRLLDVGGDKPLEGVTISDEPNPMLGARGVRLLEPAREEFLEQLAGLAAVADEAEVRISVPMVVAPDEVTRVREAWAEVTDRPAPAIGIMVETPAAVLLADELAEVSDFFSIGTNDLTQYVLAADRGNPHVADLVDPTHPAVLRAVRQVVEAGDRAGIPVAVCGQAAADPRAQRLLIGLGVDELSVPLEDLRTTVEALEGASLQDLEAEARAALQPEATEQAARGPEGAVEPPADGRMTVTNPDGLHVRPASQLADVATRHGVSITVRTDDGEADAASVFSLLALGIDTGAEIEVQVSGDGADAAWPEILAIIRGEAD